MFLRPINYFLRSWRACLQSLENSQWIQIPSASRKRAIARCRDVSKKFSRPYKIAADMRHIRPKRLSWSTTVGVFLWFRPCLLFGMKLESFLASFSLNARWPPVSKYVHLAPLFAGCLQIITNVYMFGPLFIMPPTVEHLIPLIHNFVTFPTQ